MFMKGSNVPANFNPNNASRDIISFNSVVRGSGHPGVEKLLDWLVFVFIWVDKADVTDML
jgi:hypothetical protein